MREFVRGLAKDNIKTRIWVVIEIVVLCLASYLFIMFDVADSIFDGYTLIICIWILCVFHNIMNIYVRWGNGNKIFSNPIKLKCYISELARNNAFDMNEYFKIVGGKIIKWTIAIELIIPGWNILLVAVLSGFNPYEMKYYFDSYGIVFLQNAAFIAATVGIEYMVIKERILRELRNENHNLVVTSRIVTALVRVLAEIFMFFMAIIVILLLRNFQDFPF